MKTKTFDCVEMKRKAAERINRDLEGLSPVEELAYWKERHQELLVHQQEARARLERGET